MNQHQRIEQAAVRLARLGRRRNWLVLIAFGLSTLVQGIAAIAAGFKTTATLRRLGADPTWYETLGSILGNVRGAVILALVLSWCFTTLPVWMGAIVIAFILPLMTIASAMMVGDRAGWLFVVLIGALPAVLFAIVVTFFRSRLRSDRPDARNELRAP
jgi:hypothetical protein